MLSRFRLGCAGMRPQTVRRSLAGSTVSRIGVRFNSKDVSREPQLNQFQNPNKPPSHFEAQQQQQQTSQAPLRHPEGPFGITHDHWGTLPPQGTPNNPMIPHGMSHATPPTPEPLVQNPRLESSLKRGRTIALLIALGFFSMGSYFLWKIYAMSWMSDESVQLMRTAIDFENQGKVEEAIETYEKLLHELEKTDKDHSGLYYIPVATRIAELFEYDHRPDKAVRIYAVLAKHLTETVTEWHSGLFGKQVNFDRAIDTSLTLATKFGSMAPVDRFDEAQELLLANIVQAQRRIMDQYPPTLWVLSECTIKDILGLASLDAEHRMANATEAQRKRLIDEAMKHPIVLPQVPGSQSEDDKILGMFAEGWPGFTHSLIDARDTYANICIDKGDYAAAASTLSGNAVIIQRCFDHPARLAICLTKLAITMQMEAGALSDKLTAEQAQQERKQGYQGPNGFPGTIEIDLSGASMDPEKLLTQMQSPQLKEFLIRNTYRQSEKVFRKAIEVTDTVKKQEKKQRRQQEIHYGAYKHPTAKTSELFKEGLDRSEMVSSCGLALIGYESGRFKDSLSYLRRARAIAVKLNAVNYLDDINKWISLVEKESQHDQTAN